MKIKKSQLESLINVLDYTINDFSKARNRDAFIKKLVEHVKTFGEERQKIYKEFCVKNEKSEPEITDDKYQFKNEVLEDLNKELTILHDEVIEVEGNKEIITDLIENSKAEIKTGQTEVIDSFLNDNK